VIGVDEGRRLLELGAVEETFDRRVGGLRRDAGDGGRDQGES
jgi:hypothetical protein